MTAILALVLSPVGRWIAGVGLSLAVLGGAYLAITQHAYNRGWDAALSTVKVQDEKAVVAASAAQRSVDACYAAAGVWDIATGKCRR